MPEDTKTEESKRLPKAKSEQPETDEDDANALSTRQEKSIARNVEWFMNEALPPVIGGLGGFGVLHFVLKSQVMEAIVTFLLTVIVTAWAKYSRNFTRTFATIAGKRGEQDAKSLASWIGNSGKILAETARWYFSGFTNQYLRDQAGDCRDLETEGLNPTDLRIPMLKEVFVPLKLVGPGEQQFDRAELTRRELKRLQNADRDSLDIWDVLRRSAKEPYYRQIAIRARGGYGKTTLLQHIALIYGLKEHRRRKFRAPRLVPFLLRLRNYRDELAAPVIVPLPELIHRHHLRDLRERGITPPTPHWAEVLLRRGDALLMFDGFDEVPIELRAKVSHWMTKQMQTYDRATFIVTSRPAAYEEHYVAKRPTTPIFVQRFTLEQQQEFVRKWYLCQERSYRSRDGDRQVVEIKAEKRSKIFW
jgi:hypothetical protein